MIVSIRSRITDDARLLISDHDAFLDVSTKVTSDLLQEAIGEIRSEFTGQIGEVLTFHRLMERINSLAKRIEQELTSMWEEEGIRVLKPHCEFESPTVFQLVVKSTLTNLSTSVH